jgi:hypothetical protein
MKIYLDVCCLNRPFDEPLQHRIAMEAAAISRILELIEASEITDYSSEMAGIEADLIPDSDRRRKVIALLPPGDRIIPLSDELLDSAVALTQIGFGLADAVHLSAARKLKVDFFLTVDDKLRKRAKRFAQNVAVVVSDPVSFLKELENDR